MTTRIYCLQSGRSFQHPGGWLIVAPTLCGRNRPIMDTLGSEAHPDSHGTRASDHRGPGDGCRICDDCYHAANGGAA